MAHGTPDWGLVGPRRTTYGLDDVGELAVRLESPHLWDRRGDVLVTCDFRHGLSQFDEELSGLGAAVGLWTGQSRQGAYKVRLKGGSNVDHYARILTLLPYPVYSGVGLEFTHSIHAFTEFWEWYITWRDGTTRYAPAVRYNPTTRQLTYHGADNLWHPFATGVVATVWDWMTNVGKLVVDLTTHVYIRFIFNDVSYPLTGILTRFFGSGLAPYMEVGIMHSSIAGQNATSYVDNVIVTQNEI